MNTAMRPPVRFGVALPRNQGCVEHEGTRDGVRGWQQEGPGTVPDAPRAPPARGTAASRSSRAGRAAGTPERGWSPPRAPLGSRIPNTQLGRGGGRRKRALAGMERAKADLGLPSSTPSIRPHAHGFSSKTQTQCTALGFPWRACRYNANCPRGEITEYFQSVRGVTERQEPAEMSPGLQTCSGEGHQWEEVSNPLLRRGSTSEGDGSGSGSHRR